MIKYSIIILSYNNLELLKNCLISVYRAADQHAEIIVVDNNSNTEVIEYLRNQDRIVLIENKDNVGFGKANNIGAKIATGKWLVLLNNDTIIPTDFFQKTDEFLDSNKSCSVMGPLVISPDGFPQPTFYNKDYYRQFLFPSISFRVFNSTLSFGNDPNKKKKILFKNSSRYSFVNAHEVQSLSGVCLFIKGEVIEDTGLFDENYFMYVEDMDFCFKVRKKGYKLFFNPEIIITHFIKPIKYKPGVNWFQYNNSLKYFFRKNFPFYVNLFAQPILTAKSALKFLITKF